MSPGCKIGQKSTKVNPVNSACAALPTWARRAGDRSNLPWPGQAWARRAPMGFP
ncbi:hypothetical protein A2U01_0106083, partial [Trifolium medium]|nr:hypothetical protein [Trifolium medium]